MLFSKSADKTQHRCVPPPHPPQNSVNLVMEQLVNSVSEQLETDLAMLLAH